MNSFRSKDKNTVLNKILNELNRSVSCPKCRKQSTEIDYIGLDCGHIFCSNCSYKFSKCPSCSKVIERIGDLEYDDWFHQLSIETFNLKQLVCDEKSFTNTNQSIKIEQQKVILIFFFLF